MPSYTVSVAAATAVVDADLFTGERWTETPQNRVVTGIAVRGSAAAGDTEVELFIDETRVGGFFNTTTGFPNADDVVPVEELGVPGAGQLSCIVKDAAATNPINVRIDLEDR